MPEFVADGLPYETPIAAAEQGYTAIPPTRGQAILSGALQTTSRIGRYLNESLFEPQGLGAQIGRGMVATSEMEGGVPPEQRIFPADNLFGTQPLPDPTLPAAEINQRFAPIGLDGKPVPITDAPMGPKLGALLGEAKRQEIERQNVWNRYANVHDWGNRFATGIASFLLDPLNDATLMVPGFGEEALLAGAGRIGLTGEAATVAARAGAGALGGAVSLAPITALEYGIGREEQSDYGLREMFRDLFFNAAAGAVLHAGVGAAVDAWRGRGLSASEKYDAMKTVVAQLATGQKADVGPVLDAVRSSRPEVTAPEIIPTEPPVPEGMTRLYRGGPAPGTPERSVPADFTEQQAADFRAVQGRMFTTDRGVAEGYALSHNQGNGHIYYTDVPTADIEKYRVSNLQDTATEKSRLYSSNAYNMHEFLLTRDMAGKAVSLGSLGDSTERIFRLYPAPEEPPGAPPPAETRQVINADAFRQLIKANGDDLGAAAAQLTENLGKELAQGRSVTLYADGKPIPIVAITRGMMQDAQGQQWGTLLLATDNTGANRIEIGPPVAVSPAAPPTPPAPPAAGVSRETIPGPAAVAARPPETTSDFRRLIETINLPETTSDFRKLISMINRPVTTPADIAARQAQINREGTVTGTPQAEVAAAKAEIASTQARPPETSPSGETVTPAAQKLADDSAKLAVAEREFAARPVVERTPAEEAVLASTAKAVEESDGLANGFAAAAECIAKGIA